jgi:hypothetical protein
VLPGNNDGVTVGEGLAREGDRVLRFNPDDARRYRADGAGVQTGRIALSVTGRPDALISQPPCCCLEGFERTARSPIDEDPPVIRARVRETLERQ